jgi:shikimate kinase
MTNVFLVGFMGCGKSTIGKMLAQELNLQLVDMDTVIEEQQQMAISQIFATEGENAFREIEKDTLHMLGKKEKQLIATGGGAPCFFDNMEWMNQYGITIYLKMSAKALAHRLMSLPEKARLSRPLLAGKTESELADYIEKTLEMREPFYGKSKIVILTDDINPQTTVSRIMAAMNMIQTGNKA